MPTWDETTPYLESDTLSRRLTASNVLIAANIAGFVLPAVATFLQFSLQPILAFNYESGIAKLWLWQFFTYTFFHLVGVGGNAVELLWSVLGLAVGCYILYTYGRELEAEWGWRRFVAFYAACGVYGAVAHAAYQVLAQSSTPAFDFLGPVLAIYLVWALRSPQRGTLFIFFIPMKAITSALLWIGLVLVYCLANFHMGLSPFAFLGAVGAGYAIIKLEPRLDAWLDARGTRLARQKFLHEFDLKRQVDAILDKINREGMERLTPRERRLLKKASQLYAGERGRGHE